MARLAEIQRDFRTPQVALTGGRIATKAYQRLAARGRNSAVDWSRVDLWWGDERFVPADDADRNAKQALDLLAGRCGSTRPGSTQMPASDGGVELDQAAEAYAAELGRRPSSTSACSAWVRTATWPRSSRSTRPPTPRAT